MVRIFKNIGIGDLLMAIRQCSSLLRCCRCSMSDVYIGRTLKLANFTPPHLHLSPRMGWSCSNFAVI